MPFQTLRGLSLSVSLSLIVAFSPLARGSTGGADESREKATAEFPDLSNANSLFAKAYAAEEAELRGTQPDFFANSNWPLMLAYRVATKLGIGAASGPVEVPAVKTGPPLAPDRTSPAEDEAIAAQKVSPFILTLKGDQGSGSGFVLKRGEKFYLVTNAHVVEGNKNVKVASINKEFPLPSRILVSKTRDIVLAELSGFTEGLEAETDFSQVRIGDPTIALGNSSGAGVSRLIKGKLLGVGNDLIETDAAYVHGNSGGPIVHLGSGKVLGVVTYVEQSPKDRLVAESDLKDLRHFAHRIDNVSEASLLEVETIDLSTFSDAIRHIAERNAAIAAAIQESVKSGSERPLSSQVFALLNIDFIRGAKFLGWDDIPQREQISQMMPYHRFQLAKLLKERLRAIIDVLKLGEHDRKVFVTRSGGDGSLNNASQAKTHIDIKQNIESAMAAAENDWHDARR